MEYTAEEYLFYSGYEDGAAANPPSVDGITGYLLEAYLLGYEIGKGDENV